MKNARQDIKAREVRVPLADAAILAVVAKVSLQEDVSLGAEDQAVLAALRRAHPSAGETHEELGRWLAEMNESQLQGVVSNTKGVLHEMRFVEMENADGDTIYAAQFAATNHAGYDVIFSNSASETAWVAQLKATDSEAYVRDWLEKHPDGDILVTSEIAELMGVASSGISNDELTVDTEQLVDRLMSAEQSDAIWDYVPGLTALAIAAVVHELNQRLVRGEISKEQFAWMAAKATGKSAARVVLLTALLSMPVINIATTLALIASFLSSSGMLERFNAYIDKKLEVMKAIMDFQRAANTEKRAVEGALHSAKRYTEAELMLKGKSPEYRAIFWESHRKLGALLEDSKPQKDGPVFNYTEPATLHPSEHPVGEVEDLIREKVREIETERAQIFSQVRRALGDDSLRPHFIRSLEDFVGLEGSNKLLAAARTGKKSY
ncbi:hypothetical protein EH30_14435 [Erythrobacter sp. JL475]|nr:hypothetical protein EH30_14435 [Erythrobacter sp. JL475]